MTQTGAIFLDAYRNLNAKKMFWLVLAISLLVVVSFACIGINDRGLKVLFWQSDTDLIDSQLLEPALFYKWLFVYLGIDYWLSWIATILALVSTAGIFPDLITSGSIDLVVSKPISRLRLFITQYVAGLLFVTLQVTIFTVASILLIGIRGGVWEPGLLVAVPVTVCFFSYLFSVCVFLGVWTRSTVAALLLTLLFWVWIGALGTAEQLALFSKTMDKQGVTWVGVQQESRGAARPGTGQPGSPSRTGDGSSSNPPRASLQKHGRRWYDVAHPILYSVKTVLPKTGETIGLLERSLISLAELPASLGEEKSKRMEVDREVAEIIRARSVAWVVGTSLGFEFVVLAAAAFIFCRRDY